MSIQDPERDDVVSADQAARNPMEGAERMVDQNRNERYPADAWEVIANWEGNDQRFFHRSGGEPYGGTAWKDRFASGNKAEAIIAIDRPEDWFNLEQGLYRLYWDAHLYFRNPACRRPTTLYAALETEVRRRKSMSISSGLSRTQINQVELCGAKSGLIYDLGIDLVFRCEVPEPALDFMFWAYDDDANGNRTETNIKEVLIYSMTLFKRS